MATDEIGYHLQHIAVQLTKQADQTLQEQLGIGYAQLKLLRALESRPYLKQRAIAAELGQTEASISRQVKLMITQGLLHVTINPRNRREHLTQVTTKGLKLADAAAEALNKFHQSTFAGLTDKQRAQFHEALGVVHNGICSLDHATAAAFN